MLELYMPTSGAFFVLSAQSGAVQSPWPAYINIAKKAAQKVISFKSGFLFFAIFPPASKNRPFMTGFHGCYSLIVIFIIRFLEVDNAPGHRRPTEDRELCGLMKKHEARRRGNTPRWLIIFCVLNCPCRCIPLFPTCAWTPAKSSRWPRRQQAL